MKSESKYKSLSSASLFIVALYCLFNSLLVLIWLNTRGTLSAFATVLFTVDLFTWHIYVLFALITFIIKVSGRKYFSFKGLDRNIILHFIFMVVSFLEIYHMMQNAF